MNAKRKLCNYIYIDGASNDFFVLYSNADRCKLSRVVLLFLFSSFTEIGAGDTDPPFSFNYLIRRNFRADKFSLIFAQGLNLCEISR